MLADQIITDQLNSEVMDSLVRRTRLVINCVGPYHLYSTPVVEACAKNGTHYVDVLVLPESFHARAMLMMLISSKDRRDAMDQTDH